jgi:hypothetical protein
VVLRQSTESLRESTVVLRESTESLRESTVVLKESAVVLKESTVVLKESTVVLKESTESLRESGAEQLEHAAGELHAGHGPEREFGRRGRDWRVAGPLTWVLWRELEHAQLLCGGWERERDVSGEQQSGLGGQLQVRPVWEHHLVQRDLGGGERVSVFEQGMACEQRAGVLRLPVVRAELAAVDE